jgi:hypothetical protein
MEQKIVRVACIGSRKVTAEESELCFEIGKFIVNQGWFISTGNADGADSLYAKGGNSVNPSSVLIYLPWASYNQDFIVKGNRVTHKILPKWTYIAEQNHNAWPYLTDGVRKLMSRNAGIILRANVVIALLNHKKTGYGGTGHGWRISESLGIPHLDISGKSIKDLPEIRKWLLTNIL